ncbi:MAG: DNA-binding protein [Candidatus Eisenbacteria bacterium]|nr:DNA-binding protein [Candidatus Eisenbacteria bacterium]
MKFSKTELGYVVRLEPGEEIISSLSSFAGIQGFASASLQGIGAATDLTIGYFERTKKSYVKKALVGEYEVLSLSGTISSFEGNPWVHAHVVVSGPGFDVVGGHLFSGKVTVTIELVLTVSQKRIERREDAQAGFKYMDLEHSV